jgi:predicted transcriptional regulator
LILQAVEREALTRSKIMYQAILNFKQDRRYAITDRGKKFLTLFKETNKLLTTSYDGMAVSNEEQNLQQQEVALHK